jgi:hypothetical protein
MLSSSRVKMFQVEYKDTALSQNVKTKQPIGTVSYPRRRESPCVYLFIKISRVLDN